MPTATLKSYATPLAVLALLGFLVYDRYVPRNPDLAINATTLGRQYGQSLAATYADSWDRAAAMIESGKSMTESQKALQDYWKDARIAEFTRLVEPSFSRIVPGGGEPTPGQRDQLAKLWRDFAKGLRNVK